MRLGLRGKILLLVVLTPATLGVATLLTVSRNVTKHVNSSSIHESLEHSILVFESMLRTRTRELAGSGRVIAHDPRFFSLLMLGPAQRDSRFTRTVRGMARDLNGIIQADVFEVFDRRGRLLASVGSVSSAAAARDSLVRAALRRGELEGVLEDGNAHYQIAVTSVVADGRKFGALLLGARIGSELARELRSQMRCEVTFLSGRSITGTTLATPGDATALMQALGRLKLDPSANLDRSQVREVRTPSATLLTLVRRIPGSDPARRQLYVLQRSLDPETSFLRLMEDDLIFLAGLALVAALVTGLLFSEHILRPVQDLVRAAQEMERGNFDQPVTIEHRDEIGYLAERFVEMRRREHAYLGSLEQATRIKSQFLSMASHELRTPISVLAGYRDLLATGTLGPVGNEQQEALSKMHHHLSRLTRLADDAASFARLTSERLVLDIKPRDVETILRRAASEACAAGSGRQVQVETRCDPIADPIEADAPLLEQAIVQIITNAIRFTPDGGQVEIHGSQVDDAVQISVRDTGVGIAEEKLAMLVSHGLSEVEINKHSSPVGLEFGVTGLGLGLSVARSIIEAHGGRIRATSKVGAGSTFVIEVPFRQQGEGRDGAAIAA
jgi:signal transduction histidine kinase